VVAAVKETKSIAIDLLMADAAFQWAAHVLIKRHQKEFDRLYDKGRESFDPQVKILKRKLGNIR
jgi:predicted fused transcriptional regulator/phosphomethylpyrimidine kinase